jgi:type I restriction enzyme S subunit
MTMATPLIDIRPDHWAIVQGTLQKHVPQYDVWAFGSRAKWTAKEYSDLDLAVITDKPLSLDVSASLSEDFSESDLPWKVDVVDWATSSESFRKIIERDKVVMQEAKRGLGMGSEHNQALDLPEGWTIQRVGDFATVKGGKRLPAGTALTEKRTDHPYLRIVDFRDGQIDQSNLMFVPEDVFPRISRYTISAKDVWISIVGTVGLVGLVDESLDGSNLTENAAKICSIASHVDKTFLSFFLRSQTGREQIRAQTVGSTQPKLALFRIKHIRVPLPPISEQRAIARILGTLDDKIELNRKQNETLEAMARALFKAWFVDFEPVRAKLEGRWQRGQSLPGLPAHLYDLFPDRLTESELGEIPVGWGIGRISDFLNLAYGKSLPAGSRNLGNVPVYGSGGVTGFHDVALIDAEAIIVGRKGTVGSLYWEQSPSFPIDTVFYVQPLVPLPFCYHLLESLPLRDMNTDAAVPGLNRENVYRLKVTSPPQVLLEDFSALARILRSQISSLQNESRSLAQLRDTLLPKLISGELRVSDAERWIERTNA